MVDGEADEQFMGHDAIMRAQDYCASALSRLPLAAQSLMRGDPAIPTEVRVL
jgi:hypothetical protein